MKLKYLVLLFFFMFVGISFANAAEGRLLRFPNVYKDQVVFVHAGDLWIASTQGGQARQLTKDIGMELFPKFSPDGKYIAFTGEYDGNRDVYIISSQGGEPKRLTYSMDMGAEPERMGPDNLVMGWTPDGQKVLYRSRRQTPHSSFVGQLYTVSINGGLPEQLPIPRGGFTSYSPDGTKIAYNRVFREFRTWKRYRGGQANDVWIYDLKSGALENITNNPAQDIFPMWSGNKVYFVSDRDHTANLFVYNLQTKETKKLTNYTEYDVKFPSLGNGAIAYENAGFVYLLDLATEQTRKLTIELNDDEKFARTEFISVKDRISELGLSPDGKRALFAARGELFTVPVEKGITRNLTNTSGVREKDTQWSPNGKYISYISDASGEDEIYIIPQDGSGSSIRITNDGKVRRFAPIWSPDSKKLAFSDKSGYLYYVDIDSKKITQIDKTISESQMAYSWSPDSKWIAYERADITGWNTSGFSTIHLYSIVESKSYPLTDAFSDSHEPVFDPEGKYLYFISNRDLAASVGNFEWNFSYLKTSRIFAVTLQANTTSIFAPVSDEVKIEENSAGVTKKEELSKDNKISDTKIDIAGIKDRIVGLTMPPANYGILRAVKGKLFYLSVPTYQMNESGPLEKNTLHVYEIEERKDSEVTTADGYDISANGEKLVYVNSGNYTVIDTKSGSPKDGKSINLTNMQIKLDRRAEWRQIFNEVWRLERDYFYVENMHGVNWKAMHDRYAVLLPYVSHRADLTYIIGEMISELNVGHAYVGGGDLPRTKSIKIALLGAEFEAVGGYYRFKKIYKGENWIESRRSPLTEPGVNVKEGDYILAIDGVDLSVPTNPYELLENKLGSIITIKVNSQPTMVGAREIKVHPIESETDLRYLDWVESNRKYVEQKTNGRVGYIHIPNMGGEGLTEFVKYFYPQVRKEGLVIDDRYNGGGNVSQMIIERLRRVLGGMQGSRNGAPETYPTAMFNGSLVCLLNEYSASDGDIFPAMFKQYKLGKLIGKRSWGGVVGINGLTSLMDGGYVTMPTSGLYDLSSNWAIEGHGVDPDIVVDNPPMDEFNGKDAQLDRAIEEVLNEMKNKPAALPKKPADPVRN